MVLRILSLILGWDYSFVVGCVAIPFALFLLSVKWFNSARVLFWFSALWFWGKIALWGFKYRLNPNEWAIVGVLLGGVVGVLLLLALTLVSKIEHSIAPIETVLDVPVEPITNGPSRVETSRIAFNNIRFEWVKQEHGAWSIGKGIFRGLVATVVNNPATPGGVPTQRVGVAATLTVEGESGAFKGAASRLFWSRRFENTYWLSAGQRADVLLGIIERGGHGRWFLMLFNNSQTTRVASRNVRVFIRNMERLAAADTISGEIPLSETLTLKCFAISPDGETLASCCVKIRARDTEPYFEIVEDAFGEKKAAASIILRSPTDNSSVKELVEAVLIKGGHAMPCRVAESPVQSGYVGYNVVEVNPYAEDGEYVLRVRGELFRAARENGRWFIRNRVGN